MVEAFVMLVWISIVVIPVVFLLWEKMKETMEKIEREIESE
jgi:hypothetical protein